MSTPRLLWLLALGMTTCVTAYTQTVAHPMRIGGDVSPPVLIRQVDPKFSRKMRKKATEKNVLVHLVVDERGLPASVYVVYRGEEFLTSDSEFNESAVRAVEQYLFRPAMYQGKPVATELNVDVTFHIQ